jgi:hypothetical protein
VYVGNNEYVDTIDVEDDMTDDDILEIATEVAMEWVDSTIHWEPEDE